MSLDEPEPIDSVLTFLRRYDTLEYTWVKATAVSVRLRILFMTLESTNSESRLLAVAKGDRPRWLWRAGARRRKRADAPVGWRARVRAGKGEAVIGPCVWAAQALVG